MLSPGRLVAVRKVVDGVFTEFNVERQWLEDSYSRVSGIPRLQAEQA